MGEFAIMIHPHSTQDLLQTFPMLSRFPRYLVKRTSHFLPPRMIRGLSGIHSPHGKARGNLVLCPLTAGQLLTLPSRVSLAKIGAGLRKAEKSGAGVIGLDTLTGFIWDRGGTVAAHCKISLTTGSRYSLYAALEATRLAANVMGLQWQKASLAILGEGDGAGRICAQWLARENRYITFWTKDQAGIDQLGREIIYESGVALKVTDNYTEALSKADVVIITSFSCLEDLPVSLLKPGAVICDLTPCRTFAAHISQKRQDVLTLTGGLVDLPGDPAWDPAWDPDLDAAPTKIKSEWVEPILLALEKKYEYFLHKGDMNIRQIEETAHLARKHEVLLSGFYSAEGVLTRTKIDKIKETALRKKKPGLQSQSM